MIGNVKNSLRGSCHKLGAKQRQGILLNTASGLIIVLTSTMLEWGHASHIHPMPYRLLKLAEGHG